MAPGETSCGILVVLTRRCASSSMSRQVSPPIRGSDARKSRGCSLIHEWLLQSGQPPEAMGLWRSVFTDRIVTCARCRRLHPNTLYIVQLNSTILLDGQMQLPQTSISTASARR